MLQLTELQEQWRNDAPIDETNLGACSANIPLLHAKYLEYLSKAKLHLRIESATMLRLRRDKIKYYNGEMTREELAQRGWQQFQGVKPLKSAMNEVLLVDEDMINADSKVVYAETVVQFLEAVMRSINSRTWDTKNCIEWNKIQNGII